MFSGAKLRAESEKNLKSTPFTRKPKLQKLVIYARGRISKQWLHFFRDPYRINCRQSI